MSMSHPPLPGSHSMSHPPAMMAKATALHGGSLSGSGPPPPMGSGSLSHSGPPPPPLGSGSMSMSHPPPHGDVEEMAARKQILAQFTKRTHH
mmetsp:Transcript_10495/g.25568  ORF Transcript_10495/g.25568 Transcript_10495/m.25568 type:complete len:92 (-) Transcript_10495:225-500(-)